MKHWNCERWFFSPNNPPYSSCWTTSGLTVVAHTLTRRRKIFTLKRKNHVNTLPHFNNSLFSLYSPRHRSYSSQANRENRHEKIQICCPLVTIILCSISAKHSTIGGRKVIFTPVKQITIGTCFIIHLPGLKIMLKSK